MSSGFNGIPIRGVGRTRERLAEMLNEALKLEGADCIAPEDLHRTNPYHRCYEDTCAWDCYYTQGGLRRHVYSWATMTHCVKHGITPEFDGPCEIEV